MLKDELLDKDTHFQKALLADLVVLQQVVAPLQAWASTELRDLPWRRSRNPWHILVSEVMLQQTQVSRVIGRYQEFLTRFPTVASCAEAPSSAVIALWAGLGYNRRAVNLWRAAKRVVEEHDGAYRQNATRCLRCPASALIRRAPSRLLLLKTMSQSSTRMSAVSLHAGQETVLLRSMRNIWPMNFCRLGMGGYGIRACSILLLLCAPSASRLVPNVHSRSHAIGRAREKTRRQTAPGCQRSSRPLMVRIDRSAVVSSMHSADRRST